MAEARDGFAQYYAEKLWEWIPAVYRDEDGRSDNPGVLRAIVEIVADKAAELRRSQDRLWDDEFIELCDDWAISYIGDLVGTRLVSALNERGRRVDVAKTIYYRRRKGTVRILEELISDITGWEGTVVEYFRRLARTRHLLDPKPERFAGMLSGTGPGGWADLRDQGASELVDGPFDEYSHTPDFRQQRGLQGRHNIPKLGFHIYRLKAFALEGVQPRMRADGLSFTFDPSGRDIHLFSPRNRSSDYDNWRKAREWELPAPIRCRLLGHSVYEIEERVVRALVTQTGLSAAAADELRTLVNVRFDNEPRLRETLASMAHAADFLTAGRWLLLLRDSLVPDCGKAGLMPSAVNVTEAPDERVPVAAVVSGDLSDFSASAPDRHLVIDAERGRGLFLGVAPEGPVTVEYSYGFPGETGAGGYDRTTVLPSPNPPLTGGGAIIDAQMPNDAVTIIGDSSTYGPVVNKSLFSTFTLQAATQQRPYLRLEAPWEMSPAANADAELLLEGLWIGGAAGSALVLTGDYERVTLRSVTLDPGGTDAEANPIAAIDLVIRGTIETLVIESSIAAGIRTEASGLVENLEIRDSIVDGDIALPASHIDIRRTTVFGGVDVNTMYASEALLTGPVDVTNTQAGCFRFSSAPPGSRVPHPFQSQFIGDTPHFFTSRTFGHHGFAQLSEAAPAFLLRGAENGSEIGAWNSLENPILLDSLKAKVDEFAAFGLIPVFIFET